MQNAVPLFGNTVTIATPQDMAGLLRASCPDGATAFATAAHDRACWGYDDGRVVFWEKVVDALARDVLTEVAA